MTGEELVGRKEDPRPVTFWQKKGGIAGGREKRLQLRAGWEKNWLQLWSDVVP